MASKYKPKNSPFWWIKYYQDGKCIRKSLKTKDPKVANYYIAKREKELAEGMIPPEIRIVDAKKALNEYLEFSSTHKTKGTMEWYELKLQKFINHVPGSTLKSITRQVVEGYLTAQIKEGKRELVTVNGTLRAIKAFLNWCVQRHYLPSHPAKDIKKFKLPENPPRFLSIEEIHNLLTTAKESGAYPLIAMAVYTGLRKGELLNLEWQDIEFHKNLIKIVNKPGFTTKSKRFRIVPMVPALHRILAPYKKDSGYCFSKVNLDKILRKIFEDAELKGCGLHTLRHTFASQLVMKGVDLVTVKELLGHADIATTMIYSHLSKEHIEQAINKLDF